MGEIAVSTDCRTVCLHLFPLSEIEHLSAPVVCGWRYNPASFILEEKSS
jgi:hypothetical protein